MEDGKISLNWTFPTDVNDYTYTLYRLGDGVEIPLKLMTNPSGYNIRIKGLFDHIKLFTFKLEVRHKSGKFCIKKVTIKTCCRKKQ